MPSAAYFLASSARHVLLDTALALARGGHNRLYLAQHIRSEWIARYQATFAAWPGSPFRSVHVLEADWRPALQNVPAWQRGFRKLLMKRGFLRRNRELLERDLRAHPPAAMYVSCDTFYESQYALHLAARLAPQAPRIHVEDGTAAYTFSFAGRNVRDWPKVVLRRLRYGSWWRPTVLPGASGWLQEGLLMYPEHAIAPLRGLRLQQLVPTLLKSPAMRVFAGLLAQRFGLDVERMRNADWIIPLANSRWSHLFPDYQPTMARICRELLDRGQTVVCKRHPADLDQGDWLGIGAHPRLYLAPAALPIEVSMLLCESSTTTLLGDASTCMMSSRWLRPEWRAIALQLTPDGRDVAVLGPIFTAIGVTIERDPGQVPSSCFGTAAGAQ